MEKDKLCKVLLTFTKYLMAMANTYLKIVVKLEKKPGKLLLFFPQQKFPPFISIQKNSPPQSNHLLIYPP